MRWLCLVWLLPLGVLADGLPPAVARALSEAGIPEEAVGIWVQPVGGSPVLAWNAERPFNPASTMKLVTTAAALDRWGPAHTFVTRVAVDGTLEGDTLHGNLYLQGGGDPALTQPRLWALLREVRQRGIRRIRGDLILDTRLYDLPPSDPTAFDDAPLRPYNAPPSALMLNHNTVAVTLHPEATGLRATLDPPIMPVSVLSEVNAHAECAVWHEEHSFKRHGGALQISGSYPLACGVRTLWLNLLPSTANSLAHVEEVRQALGIALEGQIRTGHTPETAREWLAWPSPPLSQIVQDINKWSNNVMAQSLFLNLGIADAAPPATWHKARRWMQSWLSGLGITGVQIDNGAGLSRTARISVAQLARILDHAAQQPSAPEFMASLPIWGRDGTLKSRDPNHPVAGRARLKTGSLNNSRALAGFVSHPGDRRPWLLVILINHPRAAQSGPVQEALLGWMLGFPL